MRLKISIGIIYLKVNFYDKFFYLKEKLCNCWFDTSMGKICQISEISSNVHRQENSCSICPIPVARHHQHHTSRVSLTFGIRCQNLGDVENLHDFLLVLTNKKKIAGPPVLLLIINKFYFLQNGLCIKNKSFIVLFLCLI